MAINSLRSVWWRCLSGALAGLALGAAMLTGAQAAPAVPPYRFMDVYFQGQEFSLHSSFQNQAMRGHFDWAVGRVNQQLYVVGLTVVPTQTAISNVIEMRPGAEPYEFVPREFNDPLMGRVYYVRGWFDPTFPGATIRNALLRFFMNIWGVREALPGVRSVFNDPYLTELTRYDIAAVQYAQYRNRRPLYFNAAGARQMDFREMFPYDHYPFLAPELRDPTVPRMWPKDVVN